MITIEMSYGNIKVKSEDGKINEVFETINDFIKWHDENNGNENIFGQTCKVTAYVSEENGVMDASDLAIGAMCIALPKNFYVGDCVKFTCTAEYMPEDK